MIRSSFSITSLCLLSSLATAQQQPTAPAEPQGKVIFHRSEDPADQTPQTNAAVKLARTPETTVAAISNAERSAIAFTSRDLDLHIAPATSRLEARVRFAVRNTSGKPLSRLTLQLSSTLQWDSIAAAAPLHFTQHTIATDADHTGEATEALVILPQPLAPDATLTLTALYSGTIPASAKRLTLIGAPPEQATRTDWDQISPDAVALRGFGNVLWYPVSAPQLFLGDGRRLFEQIGLSRQSEEQSTLRARLTIEYIGEPPVDAFLNNRRQPLDHVTEEPNALVADSHGVATTDFAASPIGFRTPSLFITWHPTKPTENQLLSTISERPEAIAPYAAASDNVAPLLRGWLGAAPLQPLTLLDHPGQPFEDDSLLVLPMTATDARQVSSAMTHSLTHAWFRSSLPWLNEGVPQFMALLQSEATDGRDRSLAELRQLINPLTLIEPEPSGPIQKAQNRNDDASASAQPRVMPWDPRILPGPPESYSSSSSSSSSSSTTEAPLPPPSTLPPPAGDAGQSLLTAHDEIYYRAKAAAVLVMLRSITGDPALKQTLQQYRDYARKATATKPEDPRTFQRLLEENSHKDLAWLFDDWVYNDRGLADLSITSVTPRSLVNTAGKPASWLVAVEIANAGNVNVEVPVTVRSGTLTTTERVRIAPRSTTSTRIVFGGVPEEVILNDGTVPETTAPMHRKQIQTP
ncbi:gluzincin family metallopeptidase [Edaphobacter flagellatus]|uniref:hypothetical protein n=1 Tax=Edaphobacter flagellatus TaxID=1933044 RepID=UPI0021B39999|nr:hypothetical protein [Edaphobacter flagellatus]